MAARARRSTSKGASSEDDVDAESRRGLDAARAGLSSVASTAYESVQNALLLLTERTSGRNEAEERIRSALEGILPSAMAIVAEVWEAGTESTRRKLKMQQQVFEMKLGNSRRASAMSLENQQAALEALHNRQLEAKLEALGKGDAQPLKEANAKAEDLQKALSAMAQKKQKVDEALATTTELLKAEEARANDATAAAAQSDAAATDLRRSASRTTR
jgi:hypothetical protein